MKGLGMSVRLELVNYILLCCCFYATLMIFLDAFSIEGFNYVGPQLRRISEALLFALPIFFLRKKRYVIPYVSLVVLYLLSIIWYYRNYGTLMPLASYLMVYNLKGLESSIIDSMKVNDIIVIFPSAFYLLIYHHCIYPRRQDIGKYLIIPLALSLSFIVGMTLFSYIKITQTEGDRNRFRETPVRGLKQFGIIQYWISQVKAYHPLSSEERRLAVTLAEKYIHESKQHVMLDSVTSSPNLIVIIVESLCDWPLNQLVEGTEITPVINSILRDSSTIYVPNVLPQVKDGRSSDAQLLINTGLLPINTGAVSALYATNTYMSLPKALKQRGYYSASYICDDKDFWSQGTMSESFGFDVLYDNLGVPLNPVKRSDELLFNRSVHILQEMPQPFYAQLVTLSMHKPYTQAVEESVFEDMSFRNDEAKYYSILTHYTDKQLGLFFDTLKKNDLFQKSIIVIVGDHDDCTYNKFEGREECALSDRFVPLIIVNAPRRPNRDFGIIGQVDIYPSLLDLMNVRSYDWKGLGHSIFRQPVEGAVYHTGESIGQLNDSITNVLFKRWDESDLLIRANAFAAYDTAQ